MDDDGIQRRGTAAARRGLAGFVGLGFGWWCGVEVWCGLAGVGEVWGVGTVEDMKRGKDVCVWRCVWMRGNVRSSRWWLQVPLRQLQREVLCGWQAVFGVFGAIGGFAGLGSEMGLNGLGWVSLGWVRHWAPHCTAPRVASPGWAGLRWARLGAVPHRTSRRLATADRASLGSVRRWASPHLASPRQAGLGFAGFDAGPR